jgi:hypothetical protein
LGGEAELKAIGRDNRVDSPEQVRASNATRGINSRSTASILADFHVLNGLKVDIIFGEDLLATMDAILRYSFDFNEEFASPIVTPVWRLWPW